MAPTPISKSTDLQNLHKNSAAGLAQQNNKGNGLTLWYGWHAVEQRIIDNVSGVNVSKCVSVLCPCSRTIFLLFSLTADCTFVHFNVLVW